MCVRILLCLMVGATSQVVAMCTHIGLDTSEAGSLLLRSVHRLRIWISEALARTCS